jgi:tetratricopeptide (TPR) repeat protein
LNQIAWHLATKAEPARREPGRAVRLAREAGELKPQHADYVNTLGVALYGAGHGKEAIETLERADQLSGGKRFSYNAYFIAMAHWQLGNRDEARRWYDRAVAWTEKHEPKNEELRRFRVEAAELLERNEKK